MIPSRPVAAREEVLARAAALSWPVCVVEGVAIGSEAAWRSAVRRVFPIELEALTAQLGEHEARAARPRLTERARVESIEDDIAGEIG